MVAFVLRNQFSNAFALLNDSVASTKVCYEFVGILSFIGFALV